MFAAAVVAAILAVGFVRFSQSVSAPAAGPATGPADGIVVFTGGTDRISAAARLLSEGKGRRLLISGVNPATPRRDLEELTPELERLSRCCIDIGRQAEDTVGNARESAEWARGHGFGSLIVVTSAYHLPRSLSELAAAMPEARLIGYAVANPALSGAWWRDRRTARVLLAEYAKYVASLVRLQFMPADSGVAEGD